MSATPQSTAGVPEGEAEAPAVLAYTADLGWHLLPSFVFAARYGDDFDRAAGAADAGLCRHDRLIVASLRAGGWTPDAISAELRRLAAPETDLLGQLRTAVHRSSTPGVRETSCETSRCAGLISASTPQDLEAAS